ncbi:MAG: purine-nucleoside phosphorylase [Ignavibacteria bacterium]|nr:purine-nucleoside phosphorylase [Ignavibacteria bacterium]
MMDEAVSFVSSRISASPKLAIICGSGMMSAFENDAIHTQIDLRETPGMPAPTLNGHVPHILQVNIGNVPTLIFGGRCHLYEGFSTLEICKQIDLIAALGIKNVIQTNAVGGIAENLRIGDIVLVDDVIDFTFNSVVLNTTSVIDHFWFHELMLTFRSRRARFRSGTYAQVLGPNYETAAEIGMLKTIGADCVGMSTAIEAKHARGKGLSQLILSLVTNVHSVSLETPVQHTDVIAESRNAAKQMREVIGRAALLLEIP